MKKIPLILSIISLSTIILTNIIACNTQNINNTFNKPIQLKHKPQQPPKNSNWKLVKNYNLFDFNIDNKFYFFIFQNFNNNKWKILNFKHNTFYAKEINGFPFISSDIKIYNEANKLKGLYRWDGIDEPITPIINKNNGKIINWNEKVEF